MELEERKSAVAMEKKKKARKVKREKEATDGQSECSKIFTGEHPLLNDLIITKIFDYCTSIECVKNNRLVCTTWLDRSACLWNAGTKLIVLSQIESPSPEGESNSITNSCRKSLAELQEMWQSTTYPLKTVACRRFQLERWSFETDLIDIINQPSLAPPTLESWFWTTIAPNVTNLTLENCKFRNQLIIFEEAFLKMLPNLKRLNIRNSEMEYGAITSSLNSWLTWRMRTINTAWSDGQTWNPNFKHGNLKTLTIQMTNPRKIQCPVRALAPFMDMLTSLQTVLLHCPEMSGSDHGLPAFLNYFPDSPIFHTVTELNLLDFSSKACQSGAISKMNGFYFQFHKLETFHYDLGYEYSKANQDAGEIQCQMISLKKLHLYRAPFSQPLFNFLYNSPIPSITEMYLWGNVARSLDFLKLLPNLKVLTWTTSCYDEKYQGKKLYPGLIKAVTDFTFPLMRTDLVSKTQSLVINAQMTKLEIDFGPVSVESWNRLGVCMPNIKRLKAVISDSNQLVQISRQWENLEYLELAHGSNLEKARDVLQVMEKFPKLISFVWKGCPCTEKLVKEDKRNTLNALERRMAATLPEKCSFPWSNVFKEDCRKIKCFQAVFEEALISGNGTELLSLINIK